MFSGLSRWNLFYLQMMVFCSVAGLAKINSVVCPVTLLNAALNKPLKFVYIPGVGS